MPTLPRCQPSETRMGGTYRRCLTFPEAAAARSTKRPGRTPEGIRPGRVRLLQLVLLPNEPADQQTTADEQGTGAQRQERSAAATTGLRQLLLLLHLRRRRRRRRTWWGRRRRRRRRSLGRRRRRRRSLTRGLGVDVAGRSLDDPFGARGLGLGPAGLGGGLALLDIREDILVDLGLGRLCQGGSGCDHQQHRQHSHQQRQLLQLFYLLTSGFTIMPGILSLTSPYVNARARFFSVFLKKT